MPEKTYKDASTQCFFDIESLLREKLSEVSQMISFISTVYNMYKQ